MGLASVGRQGDHQLDCRNVSRAGVSWKINSNGKSVITLKTKSGDQGLCQLEFWESCVGLAAV